MEKGYADKKLTSAARYFEDEDVNLVHNVSLVHGLMLRYVAKYMFEKGFVSV